MSALVEMLGELAMGIVSPLGDRTPSWLGGAIVFGVMGAIIVGLFILQAAAS